MYNVVFAPPSLRKYMEPTTAVTAPSGVPEPLMIFTVPSNILPDILTSPVTCNCSAPEVAVVLRVFHLLCVIVFV